jgi:transcriptional regulator with XRE-family HTH domain
MTVTLEQAFGERVRQVRTFRGLSQSDLGDMIGVEKSAISKYEKGVRGLSIQAVVSICAALNTSPAWMLFGGQDDAEVSAGERTHRASDWWEWFGGNAPLPGEDLKHFLTSATIDQHNLDKWEAIRLYREGALPTPTQRLMGEHLRPIWEISDQLIGDLHASGMRSREELEAIEALRATTTGSPEEVEAVLRLEREIARFTRVRDDMKEKT